jgi:hypothetical protein
MAYNQIFEEVSQYLVQKEFFQLEACVDRLHFLVPLFFALQAHDDVD